MRESPKLLPSSSPSTPETRNPLSLVQTATFKIPDGALHDELGVAPDAKATAGRLTVELSPHSAAVYSIAQ
jgi:hypothetical protein